MKLRTMLLAFLLVSCGQGNRYQSIANISADVPRLSVDSEVSGEISSAFDFAVVDDTMLVVLDWRANNVVPFIRSTSGWRTGDSFAARGNGPGELMEPVAIEFNSSHDRLEILERSGEVELYDTHGQYLQSMLFSLPCFSSRIQFALADSQAYVAQTCPAGRFARLRGDTVYTVLANVGTSRPPYLVAAIPITNTSGSWGSAFSATRPFAISDSNFVFGAGISPCVLLGSIRKLETNEACDSAAVRFSAPAPDRFTKQQSFITAATKWPEPLPFFTTVLYIDGTVVTTRVLSADSIGLQTFESNRAPFAIARLSSFVGCKPAGCLWLDLTDEPARILYLDHDQLTQLARRQ